MFGCNPEGVCIRISGGPSVKAKTGAWILKKRDIIMTILTIFVRSPLVSFVFVNL